MSIKLKFEAEGRKAVRDTERMKDRAERSIKGLRRTTEVQGEKMERQWGEVNRKIKSLSPTLKIVGAAVGAMAIAGAYAIGRFSSKALEAFGKQEMAEKKLEAALGGVNQKLLDQASALQKVTMFGDETTLEAMALIGSFVKEEDAIIAATKATMDLAAAKGFDLVTAADLVSKTLGSSTNALTRYGIEVTGAVGSTERLTSLTENIAAVFGGQAAAQTKTYTGAMTQLNNEFGDFLEEVGGQLAPIMVNELIPRLRDVVSEMSQWVTENDKLIERGMEEVVGGIATTAETLAGWIKFIADNWDLVRLSSIIVSGQWQYASEVMDIIKNRVTETKDEFELLASHGEEYERSQRKTKEHVDKIQTTTTVIKTNVIGLAKPVGSIRRDFDKLAGKTVPKVERLTGKTKDNTLQMGLNVDSVANAFRDADKFGQRLLQSLIKAVVQTQILSRFKMGGGFFGSFLGFLFHGGGFISPNMPQMPAFAPPGTRKYKTGGFVGGGPLHPDERLVKVEVGELILNKMQQEQLGIGSGGGGGGTTVVNNYISGNVMSEEFVFDEVIPSLNKAARDLGREVWASDTKRAERIAS